MADCWSCGAERGDASFCTTCGKIQAVPKQKTLFEALDLPRRMGLEREQIERRFREISQKVHPDRFGRSSAIERRLALEHTTWVNDAYRVLRDPRTRAEYLLSLEGVKVGHEEERANDPELLMTMMDLQEQTLAADASGLEQMLREMQARRGKLLATTEDWFDRREGSKELAKRALDELRFVRRLEERIEQRLDEM
jgi:molecular chaperone HscB